MLGLFAVAALLPMSSLADHIGLWRCYGRSWRGTMQGDQSNAVSSGATMNARCVCFDAMRRGHEDRLESRARKAEAMKLYVGPGPQESDCR